MFELGARQNLVMSLYNVSQVYMQTDQVTLGIKNYRRAYAINPDYNKFCDIQLEPSYIQIETVRACNAACIMCPLETSDVPRQAMSDRLFLRIVEQIKLFKTPPAIALHGLNEPLMDKKIISRIKQLRHAGINTLSIVSNGSLMTKKKAKDLIVAGITDISFSIESVDALTYEAIRIGLKLDEVIFGITEFISARNELKKPVPIRLLFTYSEKNRTQYQQFRTFWLPKLRPGLDSISALPIHSFGKFELYSKDNKNACYQLFKDMHIRADGTISLCCIDVEREYKIGNINDDSLINIYNCNQIKFDRHRHMIGERHALKICADCDQPECGAKYITDDLLSEPLRLDAQSKYFIH